MKIYLASMDVYDRLLKVCGDKEINLLFSYYDLSDNCTIPFRKKVWKELMDENISCRSIKQRKKQSTV